MICNELGKKWLYFDGAMGTMLQSKGLELGGLPDLYNITHPEIVEEIHRAYLEAGCHLITTNTFGANRYRMQESEYTVEEIITRAIEIAKLAKSNYKEAYIALDVGSTGKLLKPRGDVSFEEIYEVFKEQVVVGEKEGADVILLETFTDLDELRAAILAAKENTSLPIFCTMSFEENEYTFFGTSLESMVKTAEELGVNALGINCSFGPIRLEPLVKKLTQIAHIPIIVQPNAGLPVMQDGKMHYDITPEEFAQYMALFARLGVSILGGCCGTSPIYIQKMIEKVREVECL